MADLEVGVNSYVSLAEANAYFENYLYSGTWDSTDDDTKEKALITATAMIDSSFRWYGDKTDPEQTLEFPRTSDIVNIGCGNNDPENIPVEIKRVTCLQAQYLLDCDIYEIKDAIKKTKLDVMEVEYFDFQYNTKQPIFKVVIQRLKCYGKIIYSTSANGNVCTTRS